MKSSLLILLFLIFINTSYGQEPTKNYKKSLSVSAGVVHIPRGTVRPYILSYYFQNTGPAFTVSLDYKKKSSSIHSFHARYGWLSSYGDTLTIPSLNSSEFEKIYDLKGIAQLYSLGYSWQYFLSQKTRLQPYISLGGELLFQARGTQTGYYEASWIPGIILYENPSFSIFSLNLRLALGFRHKLNDRLTLFEQFEAGTLLFHSLGNGFSFSPTQDIPKEVLFNFSLGMSFNLDD